MPKLTFGDALFKHTIGYPIGAGIVSVIVLVLNFSWRELFVLFVVHSIVWLTFAKVAQTVENKRRCV